MKHKVDDAAVALGPAPGMRRQRLRPPRATRSLHSAVAAGGVGVAAADDRRRRPCQRLLTCHRPIACMASSPDTPVKKEKKRKKKKKEKGKSERRNSIISNSHRPKNKKKEKL